jgi:tellurite resistance protein TehA-like permease
MKLGWVLAYGSFRIMRFTPSWFSVTMGTGILNTLLFLLPWQSTHAAFRGIGAGFLILDMFIFTLFSFFTVARYVMYPEIFPAMLNHPVHSLFLGTIPMGLVTIVSGIALLGDAYGIDGSTQAAAILWWIALVLSSISVAVVPLAMQTTHNHTSESLTAAWLLPIVPPITVAATGASISRLMIPIDPEYALTIWIASYVMNGIGYLLAGMVLVLYFQRLALHHMPGREVVVTTFLPLGPCGQGGYSLLELGRVSRTLFPIIAARHQDATDGLAYLADAANGLYSFGLGVGMLSFALGLWFAFFACAALLTHRLKGTVAFGIGWWGLTFPCGLDFLKYTSRHCYTC